VVLRAPVPVAATLRSVSGEDTSYAAAAPALTGPGAALLAPGSASVQLTAAGGGAEAALVAYDDAGEQVDSDDLRLQPGATGSWSPGRSAAYVVVTPREGRLAGGVVTSADGGTTQVALRPLPVEVRRPAVVPIVR
jgi:hypothetical protein